MEPHSAKSVHLMVEAMRHAYVDRNFSLGDPDFIKNPVDKLLSANHAADYPRQDRSGQGDPIGRNQDRHRPA